MILITGGAYQGKGAFAEELRRKQVNQEECAVIEHIHILIAQAIREGKDPWRQVEQIVKAQPNAIFTVNELGCGIVPMEAFDREWRETTGRICCRLAEQAEAVYRVTCGIPVKIK